MRVALSVFLGCFLIGLFSVHAQDFARLSEAERLQVNAWMAERAETMILAHKLESEIRDAWANTRYSSPEADALRTRYRELQQELTRVQLELQKKVQEIPAVKEKAQQLDAAKKKELELSKKIDEKASAKQQ